MTTEMMTGEQGGMEREREKGREGERRGGGWREREGKREKKSDTSRYSNILRC